MCLGLNNQHRKPRKKNSVLVLGVDILGMATKIEIFNQTQLKKDLPDNKSKEFYSELPEDLKKTLENIKMTNV